MRVLDASADQRFDTFARLARKLFGVPIASITLADQEPQRFRSRMGQANSATRRDIAFCGRAVPSDDVFVVEDAHADRGFLDHSPLAGMTAIRFYAELPIRAPSGRCIGTFRLMDPAPRPFADEDRELLRVLGRLAEQQLESLVLATTDELTGIPNRRGFFQLATQGLALANREDEGSAVLMFDLDGFKRINDRLGHDAGDKALVAFARCLFMSNRESDVIGRLGGDEFCALLPDTDIAGTRAFMQRLVDEVARVNTSGTIPVPLRFSAGMAVADPELNESLDRLLARADARMYEYKRQRRYRPAAVQNRLSMAV